LKELKRRQMKLKRRQSFCENGLITTYVVDYWC
jgi:hypothetical protein